MNETQTAFDPDRATEFEMTLQVGDVASPDGQTRVSLNGDGRFEADETREEPSTEGAGDGPKAAAAKAEPVVGEVARSEAADILKGVARFPWGRDFPSRPGIPDEAIVVWQFGRKGEPPVTLRIWLREAESDALIGPVLETLRKELARVSGDRMYL